MRDIANTFAESFPGKIGLNAFDKIIFYNQPFYAYEHELMMLCAWIAVAIVAVIIIKKARGL